MVYTAALLFGHGVRSEENSVVDMIEKYFFPKTSTGSKMPPSSAVSPRRGSVESYEEMDNNSLFGVSDCTLEEEERLLQHHVTRLLELCLTEAKTSTLHCQLLLLPRQMTSKVAQDVLQSSADEPCGLRGAFIKVYIETKDGLKSLGSFSPDPDVTPTFELSVLFKMAASGWPPLNYIFDNNKVVKLRPEYRIVKRKLYSSASPVIHDFN